jgi:hypothetical protein
LLPRIVIQELAAIPGWKLAALTTPELGLTMGATWGSARRKTVPLPYAPPVAVTPYRLPSNA